VGAEVARLVVEVDESVVAERCVFVVAANEHLADHHNHNLHIMRSVQPVDGVVVPGSIELNTRLLGVVNAVGVELLQPNKRNNLAVLAEEVVDLVEGAVAEVYKMAEERMGFYS
jgi:hypothetical protein